MILLVVNFVLSLAFIHLAINVKIALMVADIVMIPKVVLNATKDIFYLIIIFVKVALINV